MLLSDRKKQLLAVAFWLAVWQLTAQQVGYAILLPSPLQTVQALFRLVPTGGFWLRVGVSLFGIAQGFLLAASLAVLLGACASRYDMVRILLQPLVLLSKATPVASFVILALIWMPSARLPVLISFLMVFPVLYTAVLQGIRQTDPQLLEMAKVFRIPLHKRIWAIYFPSVYPYFYSACSVALGLAWKSGIAAEVIGLPRNTVGEALYQAKVLLQTDEMFAWTAVAVLASMVVERVVLRLLALMDRTRNE